MPRKYRDADQFQNLFTRLFEEIEQTTPELLEPMIEDQMVICFAVRDPAIEMWVDGRQAPVGVTFGPSDLQATITAKLTGDHLHELLLGTLPLGRALWQRKLKIKGSKRKGMKLESLLHACQAGYPGLADELLQT